MSILKANFSALVDRAMSVPGRQGIRPVVEKELLHYDILFALDRRGHLRNLVFQGGTSLRLCHGSQRFSEDLDFAGGAAFDHRQLSAMAETLESYLGDRYGLQISVKPPRDGRAETLAGGVLVEKWQVSVTTSPERRDLPRQRIRIEVANVPSHDNMLAPLLRNYDFLPTGYQDLLIRVETPEEVLADKLLAFPATLDTRVRYRDLWDMQWLLQRGTRMRSDLVALKIGDYGIADYPGRLEAAIARLDEVIRSPAFEDEMRRFLPQDRVAATFGRDGFLDYLSGSLAGVFTRLRSQLEADKTPPPPFEM